MNLSAQEITTQEITTQFLMLPECEQQKVADFVLAQQKNYVRKKLKPINETALLSEAALAVDWNRTEEGEAWANFSSRC